MDTIHPTLSINDNTITIDVSKMKDSFGNTPAIGNAAYTISFGYLLNWRTTEKEYPKIEEWHTIYSAWGKAVAETHKEVGLDEPGLRGEKHVKRSDEHFRRLKEKGAVNPRDWLEKELEGKDLVIIHSEGQTRYPASDIEPVAQQGLNLAWPDRKEKSRTGLIEHLAGFAAGGKPFASTEGFTAFTAAVAASSEELSKCMKEESKVNQKHDGLDHQEMIGFDEKAYNICAPKVPEPKIEDFVARGARR